jgi:hypothetical protein
MTTTTSNTASQNLYPFTSKKTIKAQLASSEEYRKTAMVTLYNLQTAYEQSTKSTLVRNKAGFMSSHAVWGSKIALKIIAGEELDADETARMDSIVCHYTRQLAAEGRRQALAENPALASVAKLFSAS